MKIQLYNFFLHFKKLCKLIIIKNTQNNDSYFCFIIKCKHLLNTDLLHFYHCKNAWTIIINNNILIIIITNILK